MKAVNAHAVETKVKSMYERVALDPQGDFHFEMGRPLAERMRPRDLDDFQGQEHLLAADRPPRPPEPGLSGQESGRYRAHHRGAEREFRAG